jgi:hypothetical protein
MCDAQDFMRKREIEKLTTGGQQVVTAAQELVRTRKTLINYLPFFLLNYLFDLAATWDLLMIFDED